MEAAPQPVDVAPEGRSYGWASLAGALARIPLPIRAKQLFGTFAVAALLALVAVLGLVALGQSNSRGAELRRLQQQGVYEQLLLTDATQLKELIDWRLGPGSNERPSRSDEPDLQPTFDPASYQRGYLSAEDQQIGREFNRLCLDAGAGGEVAHCLGDPGSTIGGTQSRLPLTLRAVAPSLYRQFEGSAFLATSNPVALFFQLSGASGMPQGPAHPLAIRADSWTASFAAKLAVLTRKTQARADALVASNRSSYDRSRDLLIGAGAGSFFLALALGLLVSDSLLV
ncbi:MAG TPA: hypothetical protein VFU10_01710, partial [Gaiellaceae bacterium]|nr:hypothetical protein [Gaiellaceae bacterium]